MKKTKNDVGQGGTFFSWLLWKRSTLEHVAGDTIDTHIWQWLPVKWPVVQTEPTDACFLSRILSQTILPRRKGPLPFWLHLCFFTSSDFVKLLTIQYFFPRTVIVCNWKWTERGVTAGKQLMDVLFDLLCSSLVLLIPLLSLCPPQQDNLFSYEKESTSSAAFHCSCAANSAAVM